MQKKNPDKDGKALYKLMNNPVGGKTWQMELMGDLWLTKKTTWSGHQWATV